ncbi:hypothetical protein BCV70DRAFT_189376 [Testicularia cyperi]|uniref:Uncharacterized protein n=1 Tax=Testicularia cyperi TaxID=1882483 RepID=A0A317XSL0_9BASI|nr:hypothetical protein BCV70DRAFT_189376 [Testicularia cyperi]
MDASPITAAASDKPRDRGEQILSAKKKLKSYRAKQALMAQKRSSGSLSHIRTNSTEHGSPTAVNMALMSNEVISQPSTSTIPASPSASSAHVRVASRSGHGRGHSRNVSISISASSLATQTLSAQSSTAFAPRPLSSSMSTSSSMGHARTHSRSHSRSLSKSRPVSISMLGAKKHDPVVVAIEHSAGENPLGDWTSANSATNNNRGSASELRRRTASQTSALSRSSQQFLDSSALFGGAPLASDNRRDAAKAAPRYVHVDEKESAVSAQPMPFEFPASPSPNPAALARHSRRLSRHARNTSISTKRESMEIMGGVGLGIASGAPMTTPVYGPTSSNSIGSSRRRSSRMSNLPSASVLFGSADAVSSVPTAERGSVQNWDWKAAIANAGNDSLEEGQSRLTALEKLEGRSAPRPASVLFEETPASQSRHIPRSPSGQSLSHHSKRLSGHARNESIQIPNFDEIHQNEIAERRASWKPSPNPDAPTSSGSDPASSASSGSARRESWRSGLAPPLTSSLITSGFQSPALPNAYLSSPGRPESMVLHAESPQPEGLGTLMEEEEEEESLSPIRERASLDMHLGGQPASEEEERRKQRREAEEETVKRNRRASLAPRPLKLKSRPPSLYLAPSVRHGISSSPSMPNFAASPTTPTFLANEATPRALLASLPAAAEDGTETDAAPMSSPLPHSKSMPDLAGSALELYQAVKTEEEEAQASSSPAPIQAPLPPSMRSSMEEEERQREALQQSILRAYRNSISAAPPGLASVDENVAASTSSVPTSSQRHGMRTLRLGSQASLASIMESDPSSAASINGPSSASITANRRRSLIIGSGPLSSLSSSSARETDLGNGLSSNASVRAARRSSIIYKPSSGAGVEPGSAHSASDSLAGLGGVPVAVHDELKAKANRDAALLESTKKQVEVLERELASESDRSARERADREQQSILKEQALLARVEQAEAVARQSSDSVVATKAELAEVREQLDDLQAEREVLQEDIEGWRSRCQDLEKTLRSEKAKADENRKLRSAARLRIRHLTDTLEKAGVAVPNDELSIYQALDQPQLEIAAALRSPALGATSPVLSTGTPTFSPILGADTAPPQITKLLADMRQQIFNLAGSLEYERKQHLQAKEELSRLHDQEQARSIGGDYSADGSHGDESGVSVSPPSSSTRPSSNVIGKNKRHVFAYDSSMGSFGQSQSSNSLSMTTEDTVHTDNESDLSDSISHKLPTSESENVGLGMGGIDILDEIEEVSEVSESVEGSNATSQTAGREVEASPTWIDIEAGPIRPSFEASESSFDGHFEDAENAPPTPDLYRAEEHFSSPLTSSTSSNDSRESPSTPPLGLMPNDDDGDLTARTPSPRPEFIREWSFELGVRRSSRKGKFEAPCVEDFFGILREDRLPPLSTSNEALDLPPIVVQGNGTILPTARIGKDGRPVHVPQPAGAASRIASLVGGGSKRPPIARSAFMRDSFDTPANRHTSASVSSLPGGGALHHDPALSTSSSFASIGSRALSRMSLQNLTGAFSGLSGYLTNQSGAAVNAAAAATQMCSTNATNGISHLGRIQDEEQGFGTSDMSEASWTSDNGSDGSTKQTRAFVDPARVQPPKATPLWLLDFSSSTPAAHGPIISL